MAEKLPKQKEPKLDENSDEDEPSTTKPQPPNVMALKREFSELSDKISDLTLKAIDEMGFKTMTEIQSKTIEYLLDGKDVMGAAKTGSGKTLGKRKNKFFVSNYYRL